MKTQLTAEQSANLISKGVSAERASKWIVRQVANGLGRPLEKARIKRWRYCKPHEKSEGRLTIGLARFEHKDIFTLADLLEILPKTIYHQNYYLDLSCEGTNWTASYILWDDCDCGTYIRHTQGEKTADELIDALYELIIFCIDNNYLNKE